MIKGFVKQAEQKRLRELGAFSLEKRRLRKGMRSFFNYLKGSYKEEGEGKPQSSGFK